MRLQSTCVWTMLISLFYSTESYTEYPIAGGTLASDDIIKTVNVPGAIVFGNHSYDQVHFSTNGLITFLHGVYSYTPSESTNYFLVAPYWTDIYPLGTNGGYTYYQSYTDWSTLNRATLDVTSFGGSSFFQAKWVLVITWYNSPFFPNRYGPIITVQCVLITDHVSTYTIFHYINVNIGNQGKNIRIGFDNGSRVRNPYSFTINAYKMSNYAGNTGLIGVWFYTLARDENDCASGPCLNSGGCVDLYGDFTCNCPVGFTGKRCEIDIDECIAQPCYHGTCHNTYGSYYCSCQTGWTGQHCNTDINECLTVGICNHGTCMNTDGSFHCDCFPGWSGPRCDQDIDECAISSPCCNGGSCVNQPGSFACNCGTGWTGSVCEKDVDECVGTPCQNDGVCYNSPGSYLCICREGFTDTNCSTVTDQCTSSPTCQNGGTCIAKPGYSTCKCESLRGYTGMHCEEDIQECDLGISPCHNNATCSDVPGSFSCTCKSPWKGEFCQNEKHACDDTPCRNGGSCKLRNDTFECFCPRGYEGDMCETDTDECLSDPCKNNATCRNSHGNFTCNCLTGFEGQTCQNDINECLSNPCMNDGLCVNTDGSFICVCQLGFQGNHCEEGPCGSVNCQNNGTCVVRGLSPVCLCLPGFTGASCDQDVKECDLFPCADNYTCQNTVGSFECVPCEVSSDNCTTGVNTCNSNPCQNDGLCLVRNSSYSCLCMPGWTGIDCETAIDYCENTTCQNNGTCSSMASNVTCACPPGFQGEFCEVDIDECVYTPCFHDGNCTNGNGSYACICTAEFQGFQCEQAFDHCASSPCVINATCRSENGTYYCACTDGWTGTTCNEDIDECQTSSCYGNSTCENIAGSYICHCPLERTGRDCEQDFDECQSSPCQNGICINLSGGFSCVCSVGFNGTLCEEDINECVQNPCNNSGTCINTEGSYHCYCDTGWKGDNCYTDVNECELIGCRNSGICNNSDGSFNCQCNDFYTGLYCEEDINECVTQPDICKYGGTCENLCGSYRCHCTPGNAGYNCDGDINECIEWTSEPPCKNDGLCTNTKGSFYCTCNSNWTGSVCQEDVNECRDFPCQNNGTCFNFDGGYNCTCVQGFTGALCELDINECLSEPCQHNGSCVNTPGSFYCLCIDNWDGKLCEMDLCETKPANLVFVVDTSLSTTERVFQQQKDFISNVVSRLTLTDDKFKIAVASYGTITNIDIGFNSYENNKTLLYDKISKISFINGTTNIHNASYTVRDILNVTRGSNQFVFFFTDGMPSNFQLALNGTGELRARLLNSTSSNDLLFVSFGDDVRHEGYKGMSGDPQYKDVFTHTSMDPLYHVMRKLVDEKCTACCRHEMVDIMFVLDISSVQPPETFSGSLKVINSILNNLKRFVLLGSNNTQIGAVFFANEPNLLIQLNGTADFDSFASKLMTIHQDDNDYKNASSNVAGALEFTRSHLLSPGHGARKSARKLITHIYTGFDVNVTKSIEVTRSLTRDQITVFSIGVGDEYNAEDVLATASSAFHAFFAEYNKQDHGWHLTDAELSFISRIDSLICTQRVNN